MGSLYLDLKLVLRQLLKSKGFTVTAVLMLAFGIGATTAIFSIVEGVLLRPLPYADPDRLVVVGDHLAGTHWGEGGSGAPVTAPEIGTYARETHVFESMGGYAFTSFELAGAGEPAQVSAMRMTAGMFPTLGVAPMLGRVFSEQEDRQGARMAVVSYFTFRNRFQGNRAVLGTKILLDREPYVVIGVMPKGFEFPVMTGMLNRNEVWVPMSFTADELTHAGDWNYVLQARMKPGVTVAEAQRDAERVAQEIMRGFKSSMASVHIDAVVVSRKEMLLTEARPLLRMLFSAVAVVLLIACANLAGLLLVRAIGRQREMAVRLALGASKADLLRQAMLESLVLSVAGGVVGIGLAAGAVYGGRRFLPESLPRVEEIGLNWQVVGFALVLAVVTGLMCGLAPAFAALRTNVNGSLKEGGRSGSAGGNHGRLRSALVVVEIGVALVLLTASGLLLRSFEKMSAVDLGFRPEHVTTATYALPLLEYGTQPAVDRFNQELLRRLGSLPGVDAVGVTSTLPATGNNGIEAVTAEGFVPPKEAGMQVATPSGVLGNYFGAMRIRLLRGRFFTEADRAHAPLVTIVNRKFAEHFWPGQDPIGKRLRMGMTETKSPWMTVVGEVADVAMGAPDGEGMDEYYQPLGQRLEDAGSLSAPTDLNGAGGSIVLRSGLPAEEMENGIRAVVREIDPRLALTQVETMGQVVEQSEASRSFNTALITGFAVAAVLLAVLGVYSVIAFSVAARVEELAIRMALGAQRGGIMRLILGSGVKMAAAGCVLGLAGSLAASGLLRSLLFGVSAFDPVVLGLAAVVVLGLAILASAVAARRAAGIDPMRALRGE